MLEGHDDPIARGQAVDVGAHRLDDAMGSWPRTSPGSRKGAMTS